jgi:midasin (ATPase involved in ribosome maturation)
MSQNAMLTSWPLIEAFSRQLGEEDVEEEQYGKNLLAMLMQWLNDSSLYDLGSRLEACRLLVALLKFADNRVHLIPKIESVARYFSQFLTPLSNRIKEERSEAEEKLRNLVQVARYTDLNIWSVKDSSQRVHNQLCQIIHKYKVCRNIIRKITPF